MLVNKFPYKKLSRASIDGRRYYACPDGSKVGSVTTILDKTKPDSAKEALNKWRNRVGVVNAVQITTEAASRGTRMHSYLEKYVNDDDIGLPGSNPYSKESHRMANHIIKESLHKVTEFYGTEVSLYYPAIYAGTTDNVGLYEGELSIIDYKQSNKPKKTEWIEDYKMQICAYADAHNILFGTEINQGIIMMCTPDLQFQQWILKGEEMQNYKEMWWQRVEQYYRQELDNGN